MRARDLDRFTAAPYDLPRHRRRHLRARHRVRSREPRASHGARRGGRLWRRNVVQPSEDGARRPAVAAVGARSIARSNRSASGARSRASHRGCCVRCRSWSARIDPGPATALALRAAFKLDAWLGRRRNDHVEPELHLPLPRLISKAATLRLFPGIQAGRTDRRRAVVRLPDRRSRSADVRVRGSCRSKRRRSRQLCRSDRSRARRRTHLGDGGSGRAHRRHVQGFRTRDDKRGRRAGSRHHGDVRRHSPGPDVEGDEPGHHRPGERHRTGSASRIRPHADARALARARPHRHQSVRTRSIRHAQRRSRRPKSRRSSPRPTPLFPH